MDLTVRESAKLLKVAEKTIYRWLAAGTIPHRRVGNQYRFDRSELMSWASGSGREIDSAEMHRSDSVDPVPTLAEALQEGGIYYKISGATSEDALQEITSIMRLPANIDRNNIFRGLTARESLASTGVGDGVALPHLRFPLAQIPSPQIALAFPEEPIDWMAIDGAPVKIIFLPLCNTMRAHLRLLSQLHFALRDPDWRKLLDQQASRQDILTGLATVETAMAAQTAVPNSR